MGGALDWLDPSVERYILAEDGEEIRDQVRRHWMASAFPAVRLAIGIWLFSTAWLYASCIFWILLAASLVLIANALWVMADQYRDRFVVTNQKVYRVHGNVNQIRASMPLTRILDITVDRPVIGRIFGYGHFVFESAAQDQGFREIRWVSRPDDRDLTIQRVIQRTGLRASASVDVVEGDDDSDDDGTGPIGMDSAQEITTTVAPAPAHQARPAAGPATKSIFNSERGNWTDDPD
jgi:membrane protein YdbS with pleckstrin-like domain